MEPDKIINQLASHQWDIKSLMEKLVAVQDALVQSQEKNITMAAQLRELEHQVREVEDLKLEGENQSQLLADKSKENKHLHQELSRISSVLSTHIQEIGELKVNINELQHQLKICQEERDLLANMLTEAEEVAKQITKPESGKDTGSTTKKPLFKVFKSL